MRFFLSLGLFLMVLAAPQAQNYNITFRSKLIFPGQTLANVWGYAANGKEYALVGASKGLAIVDVTNPDSPVLLTQLEDTINSLWREVKTFGNYAYVTSEGTTPNGYGGIGIANLSNLPNTPVPFHKYHGDGAIQNQLKRAHALHIDTLKGYAYIYGTTGLANGGAVVLDLNSDPYNPTYAGQYNVKYIHDGYAHNDTLYAGHIYAGEFAIIDFSNKSSPVTISSQTTPYAFTHNTWLSADGNYLFTTDEKSNGTLAVYDIDNPTNIVLKDQIHTTPGSGSIVHNVHIKDQYAVTSWYKDGVTITDVSRPENLIQVGRYDTWPNGSGNGFFGAWGVYPYLPSGNLLVSNIDENTGSGPDTGALYILTPTYTQACFLEGTVNDFTTHLPLEGVSVEIQSSDPLNSDVTNSTGQYRTGQPSAGTFDVVFSKDGYVPQTVQASLNHGTVTSLNVNLQQVGLPVELAQFTAEALADYNLIQWETASESNTREHILEFRPHEAAEWTPLANIPAAGNSLESRRYSEEHHSPPPMCYYRLKSVDLDGSFQLSKVIVVNRLDGKELSLLELHCSSGKQLVARLFAPHTIVARIRIIAANGTTVHDREYQLTEGETELSLPLAAAGRAVYFFQIISGEKFLTKPFILKP